MTSPAARPSSYPEPRPGNGMLVVASNASFAHVSDKTGQPEPMSGGLVQSMIYGMLREAQLGREVVAIALPKTQHDWELARSGEPIAYYGDGYIEPLNTKPVLLYFVEVDPRDAALHYHVWANEHKWLGEHDLPGTLEFREAVTARAASMRVQKAMADKIIAVSPADPKQSVVLLQDYQLEETPQFLKGRQATRFHHIPVNQSANWINRGNHPELVHERAIASSSMPTGTHDPQYAKNFVANLRAAGVSEEDIPFVHSVSVQINPNAMHAAAHTETALAARTVLLQRFAQTPSARIARAAGLTEGTELPDKHGFVGRLDPKNALPPLLLSYLWELNDPAVETKPLLGIVCDRARERNASEVPLDRMHHREEFVKQILADEVRRYQDRDAVRHQPEDWLEKVFESAVASYQEIGGNGEPLPKPNVYDREYCIAESVMTVIAEHPQTGFVRLTAKDDKVLEAEIDFMWVPSLLSGRDFVNLQASTRRQPGDAPVVMIASRNAPGHHTIEGFYASQTTELEWKGHTLPALGKSDEFVEGAVIIDGLQPQKPALANARVLESYWATAHEMTPKERQQRWQVQLRGVLGDNQDVQIAFQEAAARGQVLGMGTMRPGVTEVNYGMLAPQLPHTDMDLSF